MSKQTLIALAALLSVSLAAKCPAGTSRQNGSCKRCPPGTYRQPDLSDKCRKCPVGTFNNATGVLYRDMCRLCPRGTYNQSPGSTSCKLCPNGTTSTYGAKAKDWCVRCAPGMKIRYLKRGCEPCSKGFYSDSPNTDACKVCPFFTKSNAGAKSRAECHPCKNVFKECSFYACRLDEFRIPGNPFCSPCPFGTSTGKSSATSIDECTPCPKNTKRNFFDRRCQPCPGDRFTFGKGAYECRRTREVGCPGDMFANAAGDCMKCLEGYRYDVEGKRCVACPVESVSDGGLDTKCRQCPGNTEPSQLQRYCGCSEGQFLMGNNLCVDCPAGTATSLIVSGVTDEKFRNRECQTCSRGSFAAQPGTAECQPCPDGLVETEDRTKCVPCPGSLVTFPRGDAGRRGGEFPLCLSPRTGCPPGLERRGITFGVSTFPSYDCGLPLCNPDQVDGLGKTCFGCKPGEYFLFRLDPFLKDCSLCQFDEYSEGGLQKRCMKCPPGHVKDDSDGSKCVCANGGWEFKDGKCEKCARGFFSKHGVKRTCRPCPAGRFGNTVGSDFCSFCESGTASSVVGRSSKCPKCGKGTRPNDGSTKCVPK